MQNSHKQILYEFPTRLGTIDRMVRMLILATDGYKIRSSIKNDFPRLCVEECKGPIYIEILPPERF